MSFNMPLRRSDASRRRAGDVWLVNMFGGTWAPTGRLLQDVADHLSHNGYRVNVITGSSEYNDRQADSINRSLPGVRQIYCGPFRSTGTVGRLIGWVFFFLGTGLFALTHRLPDKILVMTTPPFLHVIFVLRNLLSRRKAELTVWNQDVFPEVLAAVRILSANGVLYRFLKSVQRFSFARVDKTIVLDHAMKRRIEEYGAGDVRVIPNWESVSDICGDIDDPELERLLTGVQSDYRYLVLYSGNYGWGHDLSVVIDYLKHNPQNRDVFFLFVGGGSKWERLLSLQSEHNVQCMAVRPYVSRASYMGLLRKAHFGLVALEHSCIGLMSPSKIHAYLAAGVPLIYIGPECSNVDEAVKRYHCGFRIDEDDPEGWVKRLDMILSPDFAYNEFSCRAIEAAREQYSDGVGRAGIVEYLACKRGDNSTPARKTPDAIHSGIHDTAQSEAVQEPTSQVGDPARCRKPVTWLAVMGKRRPAGTR